MPVEENQLSLSDIFMIQPKKKLPEEEEEEEDDTLSLSDLPAYCNAAEWDQYSGESESQSSSGTSFTSLSSSSSAAVEGEGDGGFEFFSEEWKKNAVSNPPDNIIFCGKLISSKKQQPSPKNAARISEKKIEHGGGGNRFLRIFRAKIFGASRKGASAEKKSDESSSSAAKVKKDYYCCYSSSAKNDDVRSLSVMRSPPLSSSPSGKSRWLLVFFGFSRASMESMELRDIRNRRSRKMTSSSSTRTENGDVESAIVSGGDGARRRLWRLIRALSCGGSHHSLIRSVGVDGLGFSPGM